MTVILAIVGICLIALALYRNQYWRRKGINGPKPRPFVGSMLSLINPKDPPVFVVNRWTRKYGTFFGYQHGWTNVLVISDPDLVHEVLISKFDCFMNRRMSPNMSHDENSIASNSLFAACNQRWRRLRSLSNPIFSCFNLKQLFPILEDSAKETVKFLNDKTELNDDSIDVLEHSREYSMDIIARLALGQKSSQQFKNGLVKTVVEVFSGLGVSIFCHLSWVLPAFGLIFGKIGMLFEILGSFAFVRLLISVRQKVEERKKKLQQRNQIVSKQTDFINFFLNAESSERNSSYNALSKKHMTIDEVVAQCTVMLMAGFETTANILTIAFYYFALHFEEQEKIRQEINDVMKDLTPTYDQLNKLKKMQAFINELLRLHPVGAFAVSRVCCKETTLNSIKIEAGTHIQIDVLALHTDPKIWGLDSYEFRPERWLDKDHNLIPHMNHFGFGSGKRLCIGRELALTELKLVLSHLLQAFQILPAKEIEPLNFQGVTTLCPTNVRVCLKKLSTN